MDRDLYAVLGVPSTSSEREIRHAFHVMARKYHPDVAVGDPDAARRFIEVSEAAETLLDPERRADYDWHRVTRAPASAPPQPTPPTASAPAQAQRPADWWARPAEAAPTSARTVSRPDPAWPSAFRIVIGLFMTAAGISWAVAAIVTPPRPVANRDHGPTANGSVLWRATGYRMDDGWGINLAGSGRRIQIYPGTSADLEVDSGYLSSAGHIAFLPPGTAPSYQSCLRALDPASTQAEPLDTITPGGHADLCSSGSTGDIAFVHVTGKNSSGLVMNITIWHSI